MTENQNTKPIQSNPAGHTNSNQGTATNPKREGNTPEKISNPSEKTEEGKEGDDKNNPNEIQLPVAEQKNNTGTDQAFHEVPANKVNSDKNTQLPKIEKENTPHETIEAPKTQIPSAEPINKPVFSTAKDDKKAL